MHRGLTLYRFSIDAPLAAGAVAETLRTMVREEPSFRELAGVFFRPGQLELPAFWGSVGDDSFLIRPALGHRNNFAPRMRGLILPSATGSRVEISMSMPPGTMPFMVVWIG